MERVLVYGAGVVGSVYAARLEEADIDVTVLARGERVSFLRENGIVLKDFESGEKRAVPVKVISNLEPDDRYDLILVTMRKNQLADVLPVLAANTSPNILFLCNSGTGATELIKWLGKERVLLGFVAAGGAREGQVVKYVLVSDSQPTVIGETSGDITTRLQEVGSLLQRGGFSVSYERNIDAWLKTHVSAIIPIAMAVYAAGGSTHAVARNSRVMGLMVGAIKEGFRALELGGYEVTPSSLRRLTYIPTPLLAWALKKRFSTQHAEIAMASHANAAKDEMRHLYTELRTIVDTAKAPSRSLDALAKMAWAETPV